MGGSPAAPVRHFIMNKPTVTREMLSSIRSYDQFLALCQELRKVEGKILFEILFPIAISERSDGANAIAGLALVALEPKCPISCKEAIELISNSRWDISNQEVPFYLVSQFGKWTLADAIRAFLKKSDITDKHKVNVDSIWYWASGPSVELVEKLFYWEWQESIERPNV
jgi:hypothetical protein